MEGIDWVDYVGGAIDLIEKTYFDPDSVDWVEARAAAMSAVGDSPTQEGAHRAVAQLFGPQGVLDAHSSFQRPVQPSTSPTSQDPPTGERLNDDVGYLHLPSVTTDGDHLADYARTLHQLAKEIDDPPVCGWIVDLRANQGGNVYPMWLGVGPLIGEGDFLAFAKLDEEPTEWMSYQNGQILIGGVPASEAEGFGDALTTSDPFQPADPEAPVAVLTSALTASAGEMVLIAFKGRPHSRSFGEATASYTAGVSSHLLDDGAILHISAGVSVDRTGQQYVGSVQPDEFILQVPGGDDSTLQRATEWIHHENPTCPAD